MKIRGKVKFDVPRKTVRLARTVSGPDGDSYEEITIRVRALPVGADRKMFSLFPEPERPQDYLKNALGVILRDPDTKKAVIGPVDTPEFLAAQQAAFQNRMAYILYHGIDDPEVKFETNGDPNSAGFYLSVYSELIEFGLTMGDLGHLMSEITSLMNVGADIEASKGN